MSKYYDEEESNPKWKLLLVAALIATILVGVAFASYAMLSNSVTVTVTEESLELTVDGAASTSINLTDSVTLVATCTDLSFAGQVTFKADGSTIGVAPALAGVATYAWTPPTQGEFTITAEAVYG